MDGSRFLVTGGAGFIGSSIVEALLEKGSFVRVLDNFSTGKKENVEPFLGYSNFELIEGDIRDISICQKACDGIDYVLHQGALGSVVRSVKDPATTNDVNISGTLNMMIAARDHHVQRFVFASSSSVYGDDQTLPKTEDRVGMPLSPYAISKKVNELYARNFYDLYDLKTIGLRYFNVFGKRQDPNSIYAAVIPIFVNNIIAGKPSTIHGDGEQSRDFTYVANVVQANIRACQAGPEAWGKVFNVACGERITINDVYKNLCKLLDRKENIHFSPARQGDIRHTSADIGMARELLDYQPEIYFEQGLKLAIEWYLGRETAKAV